MKRYPETYLKEVVENQGKLFDLFFDKYPNINFSEFLESYLKTDIREYMDEGQAKIITLEPSELLDLYLSQSHQLTKGENSDLGFFPNWAGQFYALYQWQRAITSKEALKKVPVKSLKRAYPILHDMELDQAVSRVIRGEEDNEMFPPDL